MELKISIIIILLIVAVIWWFFSTRWSPLARAKKAVLTVSSKQKADLASFTVRTELMLNKLEEARLLHSQGTQDFNQFAAQLGSELDNEAEIMRANAYSRVSDRQRQLESATNMVRAFHESITFFRKKWNDQIIKLTTDFPLTIKRPQQTGLKALLDVPSALIETEAKLRKALRIYA